MTDGHSLLYGDFLCVSALLSNFVFVTGSGRWKTVFLSGYLCNMHEYSISIPSLMAPLHKLLEVLPIFDYTLANFRMTYAPNVRIFTRLSVKDFITTLVLPMCTGSGS